MQHKSLLLFAGRKVIVAKVELCSNGNRNHGWPPVFSYCLLLRYPLIQAHFIVDAILLAGLQYLGHAPGRICIQVREKGVGFRCGMDLGHIRRIAQGEHLAVAPATMLLTA